MDRNDPESLKRILGQMITRTPLGKTLEQARIWEHWPHVAGQDLAGHGEPVAVKKGVLRVAVENAAWMQSFAYAKWDILRRINRLAGRELISDMFLILREDHEQEKRKPKKRGPKQNRPPKEGGETESDRSR